MRKYKLAIMFFIIFEIIGITLWQTLDNTFYLFNFSYIGIILSIGFALFANKFKYARLFTQLGIGLYMLVYLGIINRENMQIEGFWYYLFLGVFEAAVIHYFVAKILGPLIFGRGWCGYACWTAMILDLFPYKNTKNSKARKSIFIPILTFVLSFIFIIIIFKFFPNNIENIMFISFIVGNLVYYIIGIILLFIFKDNRAFCKYVCPITVFLRPASYFSILRIKVNKDTCISCNQCSKACPMDVDMLDNSRKRRNGTECILCIECVKSCPKNSLKL